MKLLCKIPCNAVTFYYVIKKIRKSSSFGGRGKGSKLYFKRTKSRICVCVYFQMTRDKNSLKIWVMNQVFQKLKQLNE